MEHEDKWCLPRAYTPTDYCSWYYKVLWMLLQKKCKATQIQTVQPTIVPDMEFPSVCYEYILYYCLIKKLLRPMAGQIKARQEIQTEIKRENVGRVRDTPCSC